MARTILISLFFLASLFLGCGEENGKLFDRNVTTTPSLCEGNTSVRTLVDTMSEYDLYNSSDYNEYFTFNIDSTKGYDTGSNELHGGSFYEKNGADVEKHTFTFYFKESNEAKITVNTYDVLSGGLFSFYCVDSDGDGIDETTRLKYESSSYIISTLTARE